MYGNVFFTLRDFFQKYSSEDVCLLEIKNLRIPDGIIGPKCRELTKFYKIKGRRAFICEACGNHVYPLSRSIFENTSLSLTTIFFALYLFVQTNGRISGKQLERFLGVSYKTAWRVRKQIKPFMKDILIVDDSL